jgi:hypothetical protein
METSEKTALYKIISDVMAYYKQNASEFTLQVWWEACKGYNLEQVNKALTAHATDPERGQFAPKVADIVRQLSGTATERATVAWGKVYEAMQRVGAYTDVVYDDPVIHAVIKDMGGWPKMCRTENESLSFVQHRFCETYRAYANRGGFEYPKFLIGDRSPDGDYLKRGLPVPIPVPIGEKEAARLVYKNGGHKEFLKADQSLKMLVGA